MYSKSVGVDDIGGSATFSTMWSAGAGGEGTMTASTDGCGAGTTGDSQKWNIKKFKNQSLFI